MNSAHGVRNIGKWLSQRPQWDVITFNFGLWDAADWVNTSNEQYEENLRKIAKLVVVSTDKPMYILTTEVLPGTPHRLNSRVIELNLIAEQVMTELGIPVLDLYTYSTQFPHLHIEPTDVHFTERGYKKLGRRIVRELINIYGRF
jgi:lysophospholipase L1-like esterase